MGHEAALRRLTAWASAEDSVRALLLLGSRARLDVPADEWSDADVLLVSADVAGLLGSDGWAKAAFGPLVLSYTEPTPLAGLTEWRILLPDGTDLDLVPVPVEAVPALLAADDALAPLAAGHQVLLDKDGLFADLPDRLAAVEPRPASAWPPPSVEVAQLASNFWHHCMWITKRLRRGELFVAHGALVGYQRGILLRFVEWQALARSDGRARTWYDGRFLDQWAAPASVAALAEVCPPYTADGVAAALIGLMRTFRDLAVEVAAAVGADYPAEADRWVTEWVTRKLAERP